MINQKDLTIRNSSGDHFWRPLARIVSFAQEYLWVTKIQTYRVEWKNLVEQESKISSLRKSQTLTRFMIYLNLLSTPCYAGVDFALSTYPRSYPLAAALQIDLGYSGLLYGSGPENGVWYGYIRPELEINTVGSYNSAALSLEFFPLSFIGGRVGGEAVQNDLEYTAYDCSKFVCQGRFYRTFVEAELSLGAGPIFIQARWRRERWTQKDPPADLTGTSVKDFIEPVSGLAMAAGGDSQTIYSGVCGVNFTEEWALLGGLRYAENDSGDLSRFPFALIRWKSGGWQIGLGGGHFSSEVKSGNTSAIGILRYEIAPSLAL